MNTYVRSMLVVTALLVSITAVNAQTITLVSGNGAIGTRDPNTIFSLDNGVTFTNAFIPTPNPLYGSLPGANWITVQANGQGPDLTTNLYRTFFTLPLGFTDPSFSISILADDQAFVFLNGSLVGAQSFPPSGHPNGTNPPSVFSTTNPALFLTGQNVLEIRCFNQNDIPPTNPTGIDFVATVVPEPSAFLLTGVGFAGLFLTYRRRPRA
jgi:hypothetical protein